MHALNVQSPEERQSGANIDYPSVCGNRSVWKSSQGVPASRGSGDVPQPSHAHPSTSVDLQTAGRQEVDSESRIVQPKGEGMVLEGDCGSVGRISLI